MNFLEIARNRQSCRSYNEHRPVEQEKLDAILEAARLAPSACNGQPYHLTVCCGETATEAELATRGMGGLNKFAVQAPVAIIISEQPYVKTAALGAKLKNNDYRSIDIGIVVAYLTAEATAQGLATCILGWLDDQKLRKITGLDTPARLVVLVGYPKEGEPLRKKTRKNRDELIAIK